MRFIRLGKDYDINNILEDVDMLNQAKCFDYYIHHRKNLTYSKIIYIFDVLILLNIKYLKYLIIIIFKYQFNI